MNLPSDRHGTATEVISGFQAVEEEVRKSKLAAFPAEVDLVSRTLALTHEAFEWLHGKHIGRQWHALVLMLASRTFSSLLLVTCQVNSPTDVQRIPHGWRR